MKTFNFSSCLANELTHFVELKQLSGSSYYGSARLLFRFDRHLNSMAFTGKALTREIFQSYFDTIGHLCRRGFTNYYCVLRQFSAWLNQYETDSHVLEEHRAVDRSHSRTSYIFNSDEIKIIIEKSGGLTKKELVPGLYQTLFCLLYSTGIRIGEALNLKCSDYIRRERLVHIREGKFRKERYLVITDSMANRLNNYIQRCEKRFLQEESPLFVNLLGNPLKYQSAYRAFIDTLGRSGIIKGDNVPRLHDLRHTFAVHRLVQWYETGEDVNAKLPLLSTYMGHVGITSTQVYLDAPNEILEAGVGRFHRFFKNHVK